ncbi:TetR family transcriptional regulator C-terminal domain-containing protein [Brevibacillus sp. H7]|uniref:TetR family transcriptional regulator C-terminal domain-containing protein n=1 Tax=Brevibacillus sp. H7 TaxID=3349138 RepID=UPI00381F1807
MAIEAYRFAVMKLRNEFEKALLNARDSVEALCAVLEVFRNLANGSPIKGGCPTMNVAIESDDAHPALCLEARASMAQLYSTVKTIVIHGIERKEDDCDPEHGETPVFLYFFINQERNGS